MFVLVDRFVASFDLLDVHDGVHRLRVYSIEYRDVRKFMQGRDGKDEDEADSRDLYSLLVKFDAAEASEDYDKIHA
jgi:hypothetical protein